MGAGNWVPELVEAAGGEHLVGETGLHSPWLTWEELQAKDPEVLVLCPCGFSLTRTHLIWGEQLGLDVDQEGWQAVQASGS